MDKLHIQNEKVRMNMALIANTIRQERHVPEKHREQRQKTLEFRIDLMTGQLHPSSAPKGESIKIDLDLDKKQVIISELDWEQMDPRGQQVLTETVQYLKSALLHLHDIQEFAHLEFEALEELLGRDLLRDGWHAIERPDAELMLLNTAPGTYLFRKDRFARVMEEILSSAKKSRIRCFTLSYLDHTNQVREKTIVTWKDHWLFYDDDPTLEGKYFGSLEQLLSSLGPVLKNPLPALRSSSI